ISFSGYSGPDPLLIKFEYTHGSGGNNFYLDNINFSGTIGLEEAYMHSISIYPNPASDRISIVSDDPDLDLGQSIVEIHDLSGKSIYKERINISGNRYDLDI